ASDGLSISIRLTQELEFQVGIQVRDAETASKIAASGVNGLRSLRVLAYQQSEEDKRLKPVTEIVDSTRIFSQGPIIFIRVEASLNAIETFLTDWPIRPGKATQAERPQ